MASAQDVAAAIIEELGVVSHLKLQKLLYYAQGWSMAWRHEPLFGEPVEAWKHGPVVDRVFQTYKEHGFHEIRDSAAGSSDNLTPEERHVVRSVIDRYRRLPATALSELTHEDSAWERAWARRGSPERGRQVIPPAAIARSLRRPDDGAPVPEAVEVDLLLLDRAVAGDGEALALLLASASDE